jgi:hypothetical protein
MGSNTLKNFKKNIYTFCDSSLSKKCIILKNGEEKILLFTNRVVPTRNPGRKKKKIFDFPGDISVIVNAPVKDYVAAGHLARRLLAFPQWQYPVEGRGR